MSIMLTDPRLLLKTTMRLTLKHAVAKGIHPVKESAAKEDDEPGNEHLMRGVAPYGEATALELFQDQW